MIGLRRKIERKRERERERERERRMEFEGFFLFLFLSFLRQIFMQIYIFIDTIKEMGIKISFLNVV